MQGQGRAEGKGEGVASGYRGPTIGSSKEPRNVAECSCHREGEDEGEDGHISQTSHALHRYVERHGSYGEGVALDPNWRV